MLNFGILLAKFSISIRSFGSLKVLISFSFTWSLSFFRDILIERQKWLNWLKICINSYGTASIAAHSSDFNSHIMSHIHKHLFKCDVQPATVTMTDEGMKKASEILNTTMYSKHFNHPTKPNQSDFENACAKHLSTHNAQRTRHNAYCIYIYLYIFACVYISIN